MPYMPTPTIVAERAALHTVLHRPLESAGRGGVRPQWVADRLAAIGTRASELPRGRPLRSPPPHFPLLYSRHPMNAEGCRSLQEPFQACRLRADGPCALGPRISSVGKRLIPRVKRRQSRPLRDGRASGGWLHAPWTPLASLRGVSRETASEMPSPLSLLGEGRVASGRGIATTAPMYGPQRRVRRPLHHAETRTRNDPRGERSDRGTSARCGGGDEGERCQGAATVARTIRQVSSHTARGGVSVSAEVRCRAR